MGLIGVPIAKPKKNFLDLLFNMFPMLNVLRQSICVWKRKLTHILLGLTMQVAATKANYPWKNSPKSPGVNSINLSY